jgi:outer membrane protein assembly factor BamB
VRVHVTLALFAGFAAMSAARPILVFVPDEANAEACFAAERVAAVIALTPGARLVRGRMLDDESLEKARQRLGADLALRGSRTSKDVSEEATLELARADRALEKKTLFGPVLDRVETALEAIWPKDGPPLAKIGAPGAANAAALEAACRHDAIAAYLLSGSAIGRAVRSLVAPPSPDPRPPWPLAYRWSKASALRRAGKAKEAVAMLKTVFLSLARGETMPIWRREPKSPVPSAIDLFGSTIVVFQNGRFSGIDARSGLDLWKREVSRANPHLVDLGEGLALALLEHEVIALDLKDGKMRWRVAIASPFPEVAKSGGRIFIGGTEQVLAIDRAKGDIAWTFDPLKDMVSGPTLIGSNLVLAAESQIVLLDVATGQEKKRIDVGDEISAPLSITGKGAIWAMVGSDQTVLIDPTQAALKVRAADLPGMEWPPAPLGEQLVVAFHRSPVKRFLAYLDAGAKNGLRRAYPGASPPVVALPSFTGVVHLQDRPPMIIARDLDGNPMWRVPEPKRIVDLSVQGDVVVAAVGTHAIIRDPKRGALIQDVDIGEPVRKAVIGPEIGAVLADGGAIYGFPSTSDPRPKAWLARARLELGQALFELDQALVASQLAKQVLDRDPEDIDALLLFAKTHERLRAPDAPERWRQLAIAAPRTDPVQQDVERALGSLAGISARISLEKPITRAIGGTDGVIVVRTGGGVAALTTKPSFAHVWRKSDGELFKYGDGTIRVGDDLVRAQDGTVVQKLDGATPLPLSGALLWRRPRSDGPDAGGSGCSDEIVRQGADKSEMWRLPLERCTLTPIEADAQFVVLADKEKGEISIVFASSGSRASSISTGEPIVAVSLSDQKVLVQLAKKLVSFDAETGKKELTMAILPIETINRIAPIEKGWLIAGRQRLRGIERTRGRPLFVLALPSPLDKLAISPSTQRAIATLADGSLTALDLAKGAVRGRIKLGKIVELEPAGDSVLALEESGALLVIDPKRDLLPEARFPRR